MSAIDGSIKKKMLGSGTTVLIISNDEMNDIIKIVKSLEDSGVLLKGVSETIQHEAKEQKGGFLSILLGTLGASLLGNLLTVERVLYVQLKELKKKSKFTNTISPINKF